MTDSNAGDAAPLTTRPRTDQEHKDVDRRYRAACRKVGEQLMAKTHELSQTYWQNSGVRIEHLVVLAGTNLVAALITGGQPHRDDSGPELLRSWTYDRRTGVINHIAIRARIITVEDAELGDWDYRLMVPTQEDMLGWPTVERGTIEVPVAT